MASVRQHGNKWQARVTKKGYKSEARSFLTKQDAERWARKVETQMDRGACGSQTLNRPGFCGGSNL